MKRPFIVCGVMMFFMGGSLMAIGASNPTLHPKCASQGFKTDDQHALVFCGAPAKDWHCDYDCSSDDYLHGDACPYADDCSICYDHCCGYDRTTGEHYQPNAGGLDAAAPAGDDSPLADCLTGYDAEYDAAVYCDALCDEFSDDVAQPRQPRGFSAFVIVLAEAATVAGPWQPTAETAESQELARLLAPWLESELPEVTIPLASDRPSRLGSFPDFYNAAAADAYAAAQARTAKEERFKTRFWEDYATNAYELHDWIADTEPASIVRFSQRLNSVFSAVRACGDYPFQHNTRISLHWLERRATEKLSEWRLDDDWQQAALYAGTWRKSALQQGLEWPEYQDLIERALEKYPATIERSPQLRPAPSPQQMMRIAAQSLENLSRLLQMTADYLDGWATGEIASRTVVGEPSQR